jgi:hypothetical protein
MTVDEPVTSFLIKVLIPMLYIKFLVVEGAPPCRSLWMALGQMGIAALYDGFLFFPISDCFPLIALY